MSLFSLNDLKNILFYYLQHRYYLRFSQRQQLEAWQQRQLNRFIKQVLPLSPFYRPYLQKTLSEFPVMNKQQMMQHFDQINTVGITQKEALAIAEQAELTRDFSPTLQGIAVGLSTGTSGNRGLFVVNPQERLKWAGIILAKSLPNSLLKRQKIAFFLRANNQLYTTVQSRHLQFVFFDLLYNFAQHIVDLEQYQPTLLIAPAQVLRLLATAKLQGKLSIKPIKIISVAEVLTEIDQKYIETAFQQPLHQIYQCTEGFLATTCRYGTLHLNEDIIFFEKEWLDESHHRFVPIITDFSRTTQPIVRYRLDDILRIRTTPCPCGSVFTGLEAIEGRCDDIFYLPSLQNQQLKPIFPDFISRTLLQAIPYLIEYQIIQVEILQLQINLVIDNPNEFEVNHQIINSFSQLCQKLGCMTPQIQLQFCTQLHYDKKLRRIISQLNKIDKYQ